MKYSFERTEFWFIPMRQLLNTRAQEFYEFLTNDSDFTDDDEPIGKVLVTDGRSTALELIKKCAPFKEGGTFYISTIKSSCPGGFYTLAHENVFIPPNDATDLVKRLEQKASE